MENKRIVYQTEGGGIGIINPWGGGLTVEEVAAKDVPAGAPYKIVDAADIPVDRKWRNDWSVDAASLTDGVGA